MTPPPSSQAELAEAGALEVIPSTPNPHSQLSSPPPTVKTPHIHRMNISDDGLYAPEQVERASPDQLRDMIAGLKLQVQEARTGMAHYKLQYTMLSLDSENAANMMAMELAGAQREIEVLMEAEERRRNEIMTPLQSFQDTNAANALLLHEVTRRCAYLENQNEELKDVLERVQANLEHTEGQLSRYSEENELLRTRIKTNREHMNGLLQEYANERSPISTMATPSATPRSRPPQRNSALESSQLGSQPFEALLLADKVLSQEHGNVPSTPTRPRQRATGHKRNAQSVSSLPATPKRARVSGNAVANPQTPVNATIPRAVPHTAPPAHYASMMHRRRASSDSTITASSVDTHDAEVGRRRAEDEIPESRASQVATSLLRSFSSSQKSMSNPPPPPPSGKQIQTKLFGHVRKGNVSRPSEIARKDGEPVAKKIRTEGNSVGLGIGLGGSPRR